MVIPNRTEQQKAVNRANAVDGSLYLKNLGISYLKASFRWQLS